ncbi:hypothetical protein EAH78_29925 [Pseudomonas arsenicoxydans]|uniref:Uncharacterized protein n=1 Tax=Pseudomonas arsenicoxydans TaxID=702115 RepID=A0A502GXH7_9PSED|nr:hypothetical protein EAH78_29925 [Pseudomonas arsenicoxydans]
MLTISRRYAAIMRDDAHYPLLLENWSTIVTVYQSSKLSDQNAKRPIQWAFLLSAIEPYGSMPA